jgi:hypothetical protein
MNPKRVSFTKRKSKAKICGYLFFILLLVNPLLYFSMPVSASLVWSDDFNDGNYDGWTIKGIYAPIDEDWIDTSGSAAIDNGELRFTGPQIFRNFSYAVHESSVAYGNWSIDVNVRPIYNSSNHTHINFIDPRPVEDVPNFDGTFSGYDILIYSAPWTIEPPDWMQPVDNTAPSFLLMKRPGSIIMGVYSVDEINGTYHIEITRDETGRFKVYINDTLRIEAVDNRWDTCQSFYVQSDGSISFDNVIVRDDVIPPDEPTTTGTPTTPSDGTPGELLVILVGAPVGIIVALVIIARRSQTSANI